MKRAIQRIPFVGSFAKAVSRGGRRLAARSSNRSIKQALRRDTYDQGRLIAEVLDQMGKPLSRAERNAISRIEAERKRLSLREDALLDGTVGAPASFEENISIASACSVSKTGPSSLLLFFLVRALRPWCVLELGTNLGLSSAYLATALKMNGSGGRVTTLEGSPYRLRLAREVHRNLGLTNVDYSGGLFRDTLPGVLNALGPIDLAFIDGHHQHQPTLDYFDLICKHAAQDAVFVFDDVRWSDGMRGAWSEICADKRLGLVVDLDSMGVCARARPAHQERHIHPPLRLLLAQD